MKSKLGLKRTKKVLFGIIVVMSLVAVSGINKNEAKAEVTEQQLEEFARNVIDPAWYIAANSIYDKDTTDSLKNNYSFENIVNHYLKWGMKAGFTPCVGFDPQYYLKINTDIKTDYLGAVKHFIEYGAYNVNSCEYRKVSPYLDLLYYKNNNTDLNNMGPRELFDHYCKNGFFERRQGSEDVRSKALLEFHNEIFYLETYCESLCLDAEFAQMMSIINAGGKLNNNQLNKIWNHLLVNNVYGNEGRNRTSKYFNLEFYKLRYGCSNNLDVFRSFVLEGKYSKGYRGMLSRLSPTSIVVNESVKTNYTLGDSLDYEGLKYLVDFSDGKSNLLGTADGVNVSGDIKTLGVRNVSVSYTSNNVTKSTSYSVYVRTTQQIVIGEKDESSIVKEMTRDGKCDQFNLNAYNDQIDGGVLSYNVKSGDDVISVDSEGQVTVKKCGKAVITVTAAQTDCYYSNSREVTVIVNGEVYFNGNGGSFSNTQMQSFIKEYGVNIDLSSVKVTRQGYELQGWDEDKDAETPTYSPSGSYGEEQFTTLYAIWKPKELTVYIRPYGNSEKDQTEEKVLCDSKIALPDASGFNREGQKLVGWYIEKAGNKYKELDLDGECTIKAEYISNNEEVYIIGDWSDIENITVNVKFIADNEDGDYYVCETIRKTENEQLELLKSGPAKQGYFLSGWKKKNDDDTYTTYICGDIFELGSEDVEFYAVWKPLSYQITYNGNGANIGVPASGKGDYNTVYTITEDIPSREGYTFKGWKKDKNSNYNDYSSGESFVIEGDITLYAHWEVEVYRIQYELNGGVSDKTVEVVDYEKMKNSYILSVPNPQRIGYAFEGWSLDGKNVVYKKGDILGLYEDITLYAVWKKKEYTITYNVNGGKGNIAGDKAKYEDTITITDEKPVREGYSFVGWAESASSTTVKYKVGEEVTVKENMTIYAIWKLNEYTVLFDGNGGSNVPQSQIKKYGQELQLPTAVPIQEGYTFIGWGTSVEDAESLYMPGDSIRDDKDITLYALWKINSFIVTYKGNGGMGTPEAQNKKFGENIKLSSIVPVREGYTFLGWSDSIYAKVAEYVAGADYTENKDIVLYAVWKENENLLTISTDATTAVIAAIIEAEDSIDTVIGVKTRINAKSTEKLTYASSNRKIVTVTSEGVLKGKKYGIATVIIKNTKTTKKIKVNVVPKQAIIKSVKVLIKSGRKGVQIKYVKIKNIRNYEIQISKTSKFLDDTRMTSKYIIDGKKNPISAVCKFKKAYIRIRACVKNGKKYTYGEWSRVSSVKL